MNYLEFSNKHHINVIPQKEFSSLVHEVFGVISEVVVKSLGPLGSHVIAFDGLYTSATKDGFAIFKSLRFHNRYKNMIYNLIKDPCVTLNNTVGDGTTTAIAMTNFLFQLYSGNMDDESISEDKRRNGVKVQLDTYYRLPREFNSTWDNIVNRINELVQSYAKPLSSDDYDNIYKVSYVTSNGNHEVSKNIAETYKNAKNPIIKIKNSPTNKSYIKPIIGYDINANLIDAAYARNEDLSVEERDISVLIFNYKIDMDMCNNFIIPFNDILRSYKNKLLIIAPTYDQLMIETVLKKYLNYEYQKYKELNLIFSQYSKLESHQLDDLALVLRTKVINQDEGNKIVNTLKELDSDGLRFDFMNRIIEERCDNQSDLYEFLGKSDSALLSCNNGSIFKVKDMDDYQRYQDTIRVVEKELADIKASVDYERQSYSHKISETKSRLSQLKMENYIYYVGADTALEKKIMEDTVDDVIKCVRSAIKSGVVPGCQLSIIRACSDISAELLGELEIPKDIAKVDKPTKLKLAILEMISNAAQTVYIRVLRGPDNSGILKLIDRWEYMEATEESITALRDAITKKESEILLQSMELNQVFDLESCKYSDNIITSAETDIRVLTAASQLVKLLISGNQCIFMDSEINDSHNENIQVYA